MPKLARNFPWVANGRVMVPADDIAMGFESVRTDAYFDDGDPGMLLSQDNRATLPFFPTLPTLLEDQGLLPDADYVPGARAAKCGDPNAIFSTLGWFWVPTQKPYMRRGFPLHRPRTLMITGGMQLDGGGAESGDISGDIDGIYESTLDPGGWEAVVYSFGLTAQALSLPILFRSYSSGPPMVFETDFTGSFGEVCACHIAIYDNPSVLGYQITINGPDASQFPAPSDSGDLVVVAYEDYQDGSDWYQAVVYRHVPLSDGLRAAYDAAEDEYARHRFVLVNGTYANYTPATPQEDGVKRAEALVPAETMVDYVTNGRGVVLQVDRDPTTTLVLRSGPVLAAWLEANLNT